MKVFLSGNEAIARGAYENGVLFASGYPGTPGTEILEEIAKYKNIDAQWSVNEKVSLDTAVGASLGGIRSLVAMKHVGVNVAADTLMTLSYTGVNAGLILVTADDPGMHSSQNEQDNRNYAKFAKIPLLEPSDSQEAKDYVGIALQISEKFDTPVLIRITARIAHSRSTVETSPIPRAIPHKVAFSSKPAKYVMVPSNARKRHIFVEERLRKLKEFSEGIWCNRIEWAKKGFGIVTSGISYQYAKEVCPDASFLKLGMTYPLPESLIRRFAKNFPTLYVIEELDPFLEEQIKAMGICVKGKELFPLVGELNPDLIKERINNKTTRKTNFFDKKLPFRQPLLCAGCSYLGLFYMLKKLGLIVIGDIGCYTLSVYPPLSSLETCISMGSGIGIAFGLKSALKGKLKNKVVAVIGDSTFIHSGITALADMVYNKGTNTVIILDNQAAAMTGGQNHPGTGITLKKETTFKIDYKRLVKAIGIKRVKTIDCYNLKEARRVIENETTSNQPSVIIARNPCLLISGNKKVRLFQIFPARCSACKECLKLGCPAIIIKDNKKLYIDSKICVGCPLCRQVCQRNAIEEVGIEG